MKEEKKTYKYKLKVLTSVIAWCVETKNLRCLWFINCTELNNISGSV
jgi:hypothetical protein